MRKDISILILCCLCGCASRRPAQETVSRLRMTESHMRMDSINKIQGVFREDVNVVILENIREEDTARGVTRHIERRYDITGSSRDSICDTTFVSVKDTVISHSETTVQTAQSTTRTSSLKVWMWVAAAVAVVIIYRRIKKYIPFI